MTSQGGQRFRRRALRRGYKADEVDDFLARAEATLAGQPIGEPVTAQEVHDVVFRVRFGGYDEWQVDVYLDRLERQLAAMEAEQAAAGKSRAGRSPQPPHHEEPDFLPEGRGAGPDRALPEPGVEPVSPGYGPPDGYGPERDRGDGFLPERDRFPERDRGDGYGPERGRRGFEHAEPGFAPVADRGRPGPERMAPPEDDRRFAHLDEPTMLRRPMDRHGEPPVDRTGEHAVQGPRPPSAVPPRSDTPMPPPVPPAMPAGAPPGAAPPPGMPPAREPDVTATQQIPSMRAGSGGYEIPGRHGKPDMTSEIRSVSSPFTPEDAQRLEQLRRTFQLRRFGSGYDRTQVDRLFDAIMATVAGHSNVSVTDGELDPGQFSLVQGGYFEAEVDNALREVRELFARRGVTR